MERLEGLGERLLAGRRVLKLHRVDAVDDGGERGLDGGPRDLVVVAALLDRLLTLLVEEHNVADHPARLVERAVAVVRRVTVLLQEVVLDHLRNLERQLVRLGQRVLADQLHNLRQIVLQLQHLAHLVALTHVLRVNTLVVRRERLHVLAETDVQSLHLLLNMFLLLNDNPDIEIL